MSSLREIERLTRDYADARAYLIGVISTLQAELERIKHPVLPVIREGVAKMIGEYQFVAAVYVLLDFLHTINPKDWRIPIAYWPEVDS